VSNDFGVPGASSHPISLDTLYDASAFIGGCLRGACGADGRAAAGGKREVDIVIIGAGATGVELAAEIRQTTRAHAAYGLDNIDPARDIRITLLEAFSRVLPPLSDHVAHGGHGAPCQARRQCPHRAARHGNRRRRRAYRERDFYPSDLTVWPAGIMAPAVQRELDGLEVKPCEPARRRPRA
jgi:NADH dehydrogenase